MAGHCLAASSCRRPTQRCSCSALWPIELLVRFPQSARFTRPVDPGPVFRPTMLAGPHDCWRSFRGFARGMWPSWPFFPWAINIRTPWVGRPSDYSSPPYCGPMSFAVPDCLLSCAKTMGDPLPTCPLSRFASFLKAGTLTHGSCAPCFPPKMIRALPVFGRLHRAGSRARRPSAIRKCLLFFRPPEITRSARTRPSQRSAAPFALSSDWPLAEGNRASSGLANRVSASLVRVF